MTFNLVCSCGATTSNRVVKCGMTDGTYWVDGITIWCDACCASSNERDGYIKEPPLEGTMTTLKIPSDFPVWASGSGFEIFVLRDPAQRQCPRFLTLPFGVGVYLSSYEPELWS